MLINFLRAAYPFFKEVFLGQATFKEAWQKDRRRVVALVVVLVSIALNLLTIPKLLELSYDHVKLQRSQTQLSEVAMTAAQHQLRIKELEDELLLCKPGETGAFNRYDFLERELRLLPNTYSVM